MRIGVVGAVLALSLGAAVADAATPNATVCLKPWAIPDKWIDNHDETAPIDQIWTPDDTFETVDAQGNPLPDADVYVAPTETDPGTGFTLPSDLGVPLTLKVGDASAGMKPGWFFAVDTGSAGGGGGAYRTAIATCDPSLVAIGDFLSLLMGNLHGPTVQGVTDLIALDPTAFWNSDSNTIEDSCAQSPTPCHAISPRVGTIAVFDPALFEQTLGTPGGPQLRVSNLFGVFVDGIIKGYVTGYLALVPGIIVAP